MSIKFKSFTGNSGLSVGVRLSDGRQVARATLSHPPGLNAWKSFLNTSGGVARIGMGQFWLNSKGENYCGTGCPPGQQVTWNSDLSFNNPA
jgi:hypothetical protein